MLQKLNERIQGMIAWVIIGIVTITFTLFGVESYIQAHHAQAIEAEVDGQAISKQAFELQYRRMRQAQEASGMTDGAEKALKRQILNDMLTTQVNVRAAHRYGFDFDAAQATATILQIPQFQKDGQFSPDRYQQALSNALYTPQSFQEEVRQGMLLNQQRFAFIGTAFALPDEIEQFVKLYGQKRDYRYVRIPASAFFQSAVVSEDEVKTYYEQHRDTFLSPEMVQLEVVKLSMPTIREKFKPADADLESYYQNNQNNYLAPARWHVHHILFEVSQDASKTDQDEVRSRAEAFYKIAQATPSEFEKHARAASLEKPGTIKQGVLPWIIAGESDLDSALVHLTTPGELLGPIQTDAGYEVFQLIAYEPTKIIPFSEVKPEVKEHWITSHAQAEYSRLLETLTDQSYQTPDSLNPVSESLHLPIERTERFSRDGGATPITSAPAVIKAAFSHDVLDLGNNSAPIQLDEETVIVLRVSNHFKAKQKPLKAVASEIEMHLRHEKAQVQAKQLGESLLHDHGDHQLDEQPFLTHHLVWQTVTQATRESSLAPEEVNRLAFTLSHTNRRAGVALLDKTGYVVVELKEITDGKISQLDPEQLASVSEQIGANYGAIDYDLYVNQLLEQAKIVRH